MTIQEMVRRLVEERGAVPRTEHHLQVPSAAGPMHDVWIGKEGLKWKLGGSRDVRTGPPERLLADLSAYSPAQTDLGWMISLTAFLRRINGKVGVFVDAGWKDGKVKAAIVKLREGGDADILVRHWEAETSDQAERNAIRFAQAEFPGETVHSDCQSAAEKCGAVWIPRNQNKEADALGNKRS